jgi:hypothetical protein
LIHVDTIFAYMSLYALICGLLKYVLKHLELSIVAAACKGSFNNIEFIDYMVHMLLTIKWEGFL